MRRRLFLGTQGATDWRRELADSERHWKREKSAFELAVAWENAARRVDGLPPQIARLLDQIPQLAGAVLLFGVVEHKVPLPGGTRASCNDVWALLKTNTGFASMAVEGKAGEKFGDTLDKWRADTPVGSGKEERLGELVKTLGISEPLAGHLRYQLFHRAASAVLEAQRFGANSAILLVQAFCEDKESFNDFATFASLMDAKVEADTLVAARTIRGVSVYLGWSFCPRATDAEAARAV